MDRYKRKTFIVKGLNKDQYQTLKSLKLLKNCQFDSQAFIAALDMFKTLRASNGNLLRKNAQLEYYISQLHKEVNYQRHLLNLVGSYAKSLETQEGAISPLIMPSFPHIDPGKRSLF